MLKFFLDSTGNVAPTYQGREMTGAFVEKPILGKTSALKCLVQGSPKPTFRLVNMSFEFEKYLDTFVNFVFLDSTGNVAPTYQGIEITGAIAEKPLFWAKRQH